MSITFRKSHVCLWRDSKTRSDNTIVVNLEGLRTKQETTKHNYDSRNSSASWIYQLVQK